MMRTALSTCGKSCTNCKHFFNDCGLPVPSAVRYGKCRLTRTDVPQTVDPVDGRIEPATVKYSYASVERSSFGKCGPHGASFELEKDPVKRFANVYKVPLATAAKGAGVAVIYVFALTGGFKGRW